MRISASRRIGRPAALSTARPGYSLLEVLIVVALLGLVVAISGPSLTRMIERQQAQQTLRAGAAVLSEMRVEAFVSGTDRSGAAIQRRLDEVLAPGWSSEAPEGLVFRRSGYCDGGEVRMIEPSGRAWLVSIAEGDCEIADVRPVGGR
ncbi:hypothetical protein AY599_28055 [Leptolyngbya valderiana BDU 20041]|nr:hypothetical protein AY599_28055 [Leptolyngbya valderiana BDU 20041]